MTIELTTADPAAVHPVTVGDLVRSFDFEGRADCYAEGVIVAVLAPGESYDIPQGLGAYQCRDCARLVIQISRRLMSGEERADHVGRFVFPPANGVSTWSGDLTNGVALVSTSAGLGVAYDRAAAAEDKARAIVNGQGRGGAPGLIVEESRRRYWATQKVTDAAWALRKTSRDALRALREA